MTDVSRLELAAALSLLLASSPTGLAAAERGKPELRTATGHAMKYWVSLPANWAAGRSWPVVVVIPDATRDFEGNLAAFVQAGAGSPFIFIAPMVVTSGGNHGYRAADSYRYSADDWKEVDRLGDFRFDSEGIAAAVADVRKAFGGEERTFLTGWEAGGHTVWALLLRYPEALRAAAPVSTNYRGRWLTEPEISRHPSRVSLPVKVLFCGKLTGGDEAGRQGWLDQTRTAIKAAEDHGFRCLSLEVREGKPHGPLAADVLAFFTAILEGRSGPK